MPTPPLANSILDTIGHTPLLELHRIVRSLKLSGRLLAKLEYFSPGASKKDRVALEIVREAKRTGALRPGQPVVEVTSGNTGTGLAIVCRVLGHPFTAVMSSGNTRERAQMMRALGAEVILVPQAPSSRPNQVTGGDLEFVHARANEIVTERDAFLADQFNAPANALAHERYTAPEMWEQSRGTIDVLVDFVGTGGSFAGCTRFLKKVNPKLRAYVVEPLNAPALARGICADHSHSIQGGGYGLSRLAQIDPGLVDGYRTCSDDQAAAGAVLLGMEESVFAGFSSGANLHAAIELLRAHERDRTIAFMVCDSGLKYLSTHLAEDYCACT